MSFLKGLTSIVAKRYLNKQTGEIVEAESYTIEHNEPIGKSGYQKYIQIPAMKIPSKHQIIELPRFNENFKEVK